MAEAARSTGLELKAPLRDLRGGLPLTPSPPGNLKGHPGGGTTERLDSAPGRRRSVPNGGQPARFRVSLGSARFRDSARVHLPAGWHGAAESPGHSSCSVSSARLARTVALERGRKLAEPALRRKFNELQTSDLTGHANTFKQLRRSPNLRGEGLGDRASVSSTNQGEIHAGIG